MSQDDKAEKKQYFFFVGSAKYETDLAVVSGAYVKSRIPDFPAGGGLELEGHGNEPDKAFGDTDTVSLKVGHGEGPRRFNIATTASAS